MYYNQKNVKVSIRLIFFDNLILLFKKSGEDPGNFRKISCRSSVFYFEYYAGTNSELNAFDST